MHSSRSIAAAISTSTASFVLCLLAGCSGWTYGTARKNQKIADPYAEGNFLPEYAQIGWLWPGEQTTSGPVPYVPREGDLIFTSSINPAQSLAYAYLARIGLPHHVLMVIRNSSGQLATFEVGSGGDRSVAIRRISTRLNKHEDLYRGSTIAIRQIRRPLTPEESYCLTCFAETQVGKPFSPSIQFVPIGLPGRPTGLTSDSQETWFCSEIVVQALRVSGLMVGNGKPKSIVPEDLYHDERCDLGHVWACPQNWTPRPEPSKRRPVFDPDRKLKKR